LSSLCGYFYSFSSELLRFQYIGSCASGIPQKTLDFAAGVL
jgi:hypothetical protein